MRPPPPGRGPPRAVRRPRWLSLLFGLLALAAVIAASLPPGELERFVALPRAARPEWLLLALLAQAGTRVCAAAVWRLTRRGWGGGCAWPRWRR